MRGKFKLYTDVSSNYTHSNSTNQLKSPQYTHFLLRIQYHVGSGFLTTRLPAAVYKQFIMAVNGLVRICRISLNAARMLTDKAAEIQIQTTALPLWGMHSSSCYSSRASVQSTQKNVG
jgi:hypothetical protein